MQKSSQLLDDGKVDEAISYCEKALVLYRKHNFQAGIASAYFTLGNAYLYDGETDLALVNLKKALKTFTKIRNYNSVANCYLNLGNVYADRCDYSNSLDCYYRSLEWGKKLKRVDLFADCYRNIGIVEYSIGDYSKAIKSFHIALRYCERNHQRGNIGEIYNCLGNVYIEQGDPKAALRVYSTSLKIALELNEKYNIGNAYLNIGSVYNDLGRYNEALVKYDAAIEIYEERNDQFGLSMTYNSIGEVYCKTGRYEEAIEISTKALKIALKNSDQGEAVCSYINLGNTYIEQKKLDKAREILNLSLKLSKEIGSKPLVTEIYEVLIKLEKKSNNFKAAFDNQRLWIIYKDSINNEATKRQSFRTVLEYSFEKKALIAKENNDRAVFKLKSQNKLSSQKQLYLVIILVVFICSALVIWYFARRLLNNRKKLSEVLSNENAHKEVLLQEVHHRVNNSLQMISSLLAMQGDSTDNEEIKDYLLKSENRIHAMSVMHQLLHLGNSKLEVNMLDYFNEVFDFYSTILESKSNVKLNANIPSVLFHTKLAMPLALILNELITNSLKYAFPSDEGVIDVSLIRESDNSWTFSIRDNGIGFAETEAEKDKSSIGLNLVNLMVKQINGKIAMKTIGGLSVEIHFAEK